MKGLFRRLLPLALAAALALAGCGGSPAPDTTSTPRPAGLENPNVLLILAESFFDVTGLPGVTYETDPLSDFHRAQAQGVSGRFLTRTVSYGTCAIEMEVLTGVNTRFFPGEEALYHWAPEKFDGFPALPALFRAAGYYTAYLHTFNDGIYSRTPVYRHLGFDDLYFSDGFDQILPEAAEAPDYWAYMAGRVAGEFYSDDLFADGMIALYEREEAAAPVFLCGATMENHQDYPADKYDAYDFPFEAALSEEAAGALSALTQGAADCSAALGKLMDYFSACEEPTVIIFYGDHRPGLWLEEGGSIYEQLGLAPADSTLWDLAAKRALYATDYVIWANDARLLSAAAGTRRDSSSNFLGLDVLEAAGREPTGYWQLLSGLRPLYRAWTDAYFAAADGSFYQTLEDALGGTGREALETVCRWLREQFLE